MIPNAPCQNVKAIVANAIPFRKRTGPLEGAQLPLPSVRELLCPQGYPDKVSSARGDLEIGSTAEQLDCAF